MPVILLQIRCHWVLLSMDEGQGIVGHR